MAIEFENPLTAGTVLVRSDIRSQNYTPGSAGWIIEADGDAEFNNLTIRGDFQGNNFTLDDDGMFFYDGTPALGNLILSLANVAGTDAYGNDYLEGVTVYDPNGTKIRLVAGGALALQEFTPPDLTGSTWDSGSMGTTIANIYDGNVNAPGLFLESPNETSGVARSTIYLFGNSDTATTSSVIRHVSQDHQFVTGDMQLSGGQITEYDGNSFTSFTPTVTNGGTATFTTTSGWYQRIGKMIFFSAYIVVNAAGSGGLTVRVALPTEPDRTINQVIPLSATSLFGAGIINNGHAVILTTGSGTNVDGLRVSNNGAANADATVGGANLLANATITLSGWYREA